MKDANDLAAVGGGGGVELHLVSSGLPELDPQTASRSVLLSASASVRAAQRANVLRPLQEFSAVRRWLHSVESHLQAVVHVRLLIALALLMVGCGPATMLPSHAVGDACDQTKDASYCLAAGRVMNCERGCPPGQSPPNCNGTVWVSRDCNACPGAGEPLMNCDASGLCSCN